MSAAMGHVPGKPKASFRPADFNYLLDKVRRAEMRTEPFRHIWIDDFFDPAHFSALVEDPQIRLPQVGDDRSLIQALQGSGWKEISFPGTTTEIETYLAWHADKGRQQGVNNENCEGFGVVFRLARPAANSPVAAMTDFMKTREFWSTLADRFGIDLERVVPDSGIQKYLDGYEISPHPDVRRKALTFMVNLNPAPDSEALDYHTHYMRFLPEHDHIRVTWRDDTSKEREWVSWSKCETLVQQRRNNSIVIFAPDETTLHAVRASYDHLRTQRTQCYGNLWFVKPGEKSQAWGWRAKVKDMLASLRR